jgi:hypothetical protein
MQSPLQLTRKVLCVVKNITPQQGACTLTVSADAVPAGDARRWAAIASWPYNNYIYERRQVKQ